jgi:hypothetical protein
MADAFFSSLWRILERYGCAGDSRHHSLRKISQASHLAIM